MGLRPILPLCAALAALPLSAQAVSIRSYNLAGVFDAVDTRCPLAKDALPTLRRFTRLWEARLAQEANPRTLLRMLDDSRMIVRGTAEQLQCVTTALDWLSEENLAELRLQCTLVTFSGKCAAAAGLEPGKPKPVDVVAAGALLKQVQQLGGTLQNLPEVKVLPLQPFVVGKAGKDRNLPVLRVRGEGMQIAADQALLGIQLFVGEPPADLTLQPSRPLLATTLVLKAGEGALLRVAKGDPTTVLWLQLTGIGKAPAAKPAPTAPALPKPQPPKRR